MISANSRYKSSTVVPGVDLHNADIMVILFSQPQDVSFRYTFHQVTGADYVDVLANQYYGDPTLWWVIADANPEIVNWSVLTPGSLLRIPSLASALA